MAKETVNLVKKKKETNVRFKKMKSDVALDEYKAIRKVVKQAIRRIKRGHEMSLLNQIKENPEALYTYIKSKMEMREKVGLLKDKKEVCA